MYQVFGILNRFVSYTGKNYKAIETLLPNPSNLMGHGSAYEGGSVGIGEDGTAKLSIQKIRSLLSSWDRIKNLFFVAKNKNESDKTPT